MISSMSSQETGELSHQFIVAVRRGFLYSLRNKPEPTDLISRVRNVGASLINHGSTYIQLRDGDGSITSYYYGNGFTDSQRMFTAISCGLVAAVGGIAASAAGLPIPELAKNAALFALPFLGGTHGPGRVYRRTSEVSPDAKMAFDISAAQYADLRQELQEASLIKRDGFFSMLLNNCSGYAIRFATSHGFDVPHPFLPTPRKLAIAMESYKPPEIQPSF